MAVISISSWPAPYYKLVGWKSTVHFRADLRLRRRMELKAMDIVGWSCGKESRSCTAHEVCDESLGVNNIVDFRCEVIRTPKDKLEEVIMAYRVFEGNRRAMLDFIFVVWYPGKHNLQTRQYSNDCWGLSHVRQPSKAQSVYPCTWLDQSCRDAAHQRVVLMRNMLFLG